MMRRPVARRRGIGLLGATAVAGTAYYAGSKSAQQTAARQQQEQYQEDRLTQLEAAQAAAPPPPPAAPAPAAPPATGTDERIRQLRELDELRKAGVLTEAEFEAQKQRILGA